MIRIDIEQAIEQAIKDTMPEGALDADAHDALVKAASDNIEAKAEKRVEIDARKGKMTTPDSGDKPIQLVVNIPYTDAVAHAVLSLPADIIIMPGRQIPMFKTSVTPPPLDGQQTMDFGASESGEQESPPDDMPPPLDDDITMEPDPEAEAGAARSARELATKGSVWMKKTTAEHWRIVGVSRKDERVSMEPVNGDDPIDVVSYDQLAKQFTFVEAAS